MSLVFFSQNWGEVNQNGNNLNKFYKDVQKSSNQWELFWQYSVPFAHQKTANGASLSLSFNPKTSSKARCSAACLYDSPHQRWRRHCHHQWDNQQPSLHLEDLVVHHSLATTKKYLQSRQHVLCNMCFGMLQRKILGYRGNQNLKASISRTLGKAFQNVRSSTVLMNWWLENIQQNSRWKLEFQASRCQSLRCLGWQWHQKIDYTSLIYISKNT